MVKAPPSWQRGGRGYGLAPVPEGIIEFPMPACKTKLRVPHNVLDSAIRQHIAGCVICRFDRTSKRR